MPTLYTYNCESCEKESKILEDGEQPGRFVEFRNMGDRDNPIDCPSCKSSATRIKIPENFTVWWGNIYNSKKTSLGPTVDYYPPTRDRKRKDATRHIDMSPVGEAAKVLKEDAGKAPSVKDVPSPGVSTPKGG
jgi:hypothetical protein